MSVLQRKELEQSPLADLHAIASEIGIERYRALRQEELVKAILAAQGGEAAPDEETSDDRPETSEAEPEAESEKEPEEPAAPEGDPVSGVLDVLPNGSGFLRAAEGDDVYISPAQIRRCELRAGDEVAGPSRPARRNERHPSLVRVETVNGRDAEPPEERPLFGDLTPVYPTERLTGPAALDAVPFGKGSRVAVGGGPGAGATSLLRELVAAVAGKHSDVALSVVLVGARPEELTEWTRDSDVSVTGGSFDRSGETQAQAAELAVERAKRVAERGGDALVVVDSLESLPNGVARRVFGAARNIEDGGSLTVVAATGMAWEPQRQASTRISLDPPAEDGTPQVSASRSATLRADLLK
ncbi:MAG: Rho termination factor N-terminal domain-containing protein [Candidatus Limnocylindria bacterium]